MLENLYTTKMSAEKKKLQHRFTKIRQKSGRVSRIMALAVTIVIAVTMLFASVVMAAIESAEEEPIILYTQGKAVVLSDKPFIKDNTVYLPLRETLEKLGVFEINGNSLEWDNGRIWITVSEGNGEDPTYYDINIGSDMLGVSHNLQNSLIMSVRLNEKVPALLVNEKTYVPYNFVDYMLNKGLTWCTEKYDFLITINGEASSAIVSQKLTWPSVSEEISNTFGKRENPVTKEVIEHNGIDIAAAEGSEVLAAARGTVSETGFDAEKGNYIIITSDNNITTLYAQLLNVNVIAGDEVESGDVIGTVGKTGMATGAHLHFEVMINGKHYNPEIIF